MATRFLKLTSYDDQGRPTAKVALNMEQMQVVYFYERGAEAEASAVVCGNGFSFRTYNTLEIEILQDYTNRF